LGTISGTVWDLGAGKKAKMGGRAELGTISTAVWYGGLCTAGRTRVKEYWGSIPGLVAGGIAENGTGGWECRISDYN
jgi:hypothetical protein